MENILRLQDTLSTLPPAERPTVSKQEAIRMLAPALIELQAKGYTFEEIQTLLSANGIALSVATLKCYLHRSKQRARPGRATRKAPFEVRPRAEREHPSPELDRSAHRVEGQGVARETSPPKGTFVPIKDSEEI